MPDNQRSKDLNNSPWQPLPANSAEGAYASVYLSDDLARVPVRHVTRPGDNKSDPNLETGTYGLCSTCEPGMRASIVKHGIPLVFFLTNFRGDGRVLTGYYEIGWFARGPADGRSRDYALAAKNLRFVRPIPIAELPKRAAGELGTGFRLFKRLSSTASDELTELMASRDDLTSQYLAEIDRLERFVLKHTGFRYPTWRRTEPWTWQDASRYVESADGPSGETRNASPTGRWRCKACGDTITNSARLKACPACGALGSLVVDEE